MANPRKKWAVKLGFPASPYERCTSELAAWRKIDELAMQWSTKILRTPHVTVYVDEGHGRGWQTHKRVDLRDHPQEEQPQDA